MHDAFLRAGLLSAALALAACTQSSGQGAPSGPMPDRAVTLHLTNSGDQTLSCSIAFGHWVYQELGKFVPGQSRQVPMMQAAKDGALYVNRADGQRQMMIETIQCGRPENFKVTAGQVDLAAVRSTRVTRIEAQCAAPPGAPRVTCKISDLGR